MDDKEKKTLEERVAQLEEHELILLRLIQKLDDRLKGKQDRKEQW